MVLRGIKSIAKWKKDKEDAKEGALNKKAHFQPFYTYNGIILKLANKFNDIPMNKSFLVFMQRMNPNCWMLPIFQTMHSLRH